MSSVYERVLGDRFEHLDPQLRLYFGPPAGSTGRGTGTGTGTGSGTGTGTGSSTGSSTGTGTGTGTGTYDIAGSRHRWLWPVLAWLAWRRVLFPEFGRDIPFEIVNTTNADGTLSARREFAFPRRARTRVRAPATRTTRTRVRAPATRTTGTRTRTRTRTMVDTMSVVDGSLHDRLGRRGGLEVEFALVVVDGGLTMRSRRQWLHLGPLRLRMPGLVRVALAESAAGGRQHVDVRMTAPVLGEVFRYAGWFDYELRSP